MKEMVGGCCVCSDDRGWDENPLVYCDGHGCNVAVHQACYGIVEVPKGPWFCRKCESQERAARVRCELCPQRTGALKRADLGGNGWCHVVCALFIPEAWFLNVQTMEPIVLKSVPAERFSKVCYVCDENKMESKATQGACMQCNKAGCKNHFHVTCAQAHGLLCEEAGSNGDSVKYCGYCIYHYKKLKKDSHIKQIPAFKPIPSEARTPDSSPEKPHNEDGDIRTKTHSGSSNSGSGLSGGVFRTKAETRHVSPTLLSTSTTSLPLDREPLHSSPQSDSAWKLSTLKSRALNEQKSSLEAKRAAAASQSSATSPSISITAITTSPTITSSPSTTSTTITPTTTTTNTTTTVDHNVSMSPNSSLNSTLDSPPPKMPSPVKMSSPSQSSTFSSKFEKFLTSPPTTESPISMAPENMVQDSTAASYKRKQAKAAEKAEKRAAKKRRKAQKRREDEAAKGGPGSLGSSPVIDPGTYSAMPVLTAESGEGVATSAPGVNVSAATSTTTTSQTVFGGEPIFHSLASQIPVSSSKHETETRVFETTPNITPNVPSLPMSTISTKVGSVMPKIEDFPTTFEQLLERHWEQGNQFLINKATEFDSSLLSCLQQLRVENQRLANHVKTLNERRDHLSNVNVKLAASLRPPSEVSPMGDGVRAAPRLSSGSDSSVKSLPNKCGGGGGVVTPKPLSRPSSAHQSFVNPRDHSPSKVSRKTSSASPDTRIMGHNSNPIIANALQLPPLSDQQRAHFLQQQQTNNMLQRSLVDNNPPFLYPVMSGPRPLPRGPPVSIISAMHSYTSNNSVPHAPIHMTMTPADHKGKDKT